MALVASLASWDEPSVSSFAAWTARELNEASTLLNGILTPRDINTPKPPPADQRQVQSAIRQLSENSRLEEVYQDFIDMVDARFVLVKNDISRYFNRLESNAALSRTPDTDQIMLEMLDRLAAWQRAWGSPLRIFNDSKVMTHFTHIFHSHLHAVLPASFPDRIRDLLSNSLASLPDHLAEPPEHSEHLSIIPENFTKIPPPSIHLPRLGFLPRYASTLTNVAFEEISRIAREEADKGWGTRRLTRARQRISNGLANWLSGMFDSNGSETMGPMFARFDFHLCKCFFEIRTDELFDIIRDYPESMGALEDLKECLDKVDQSGVLVDKLRASNVKRLLHPGAETRNVITLYISTIRCLRILDPPGVLLHKVAEPIRRHLKDRPDTVKCVVTALVEGEELQDENEAGGLIQASNDDTVEDFLDPKWEPEPVDAAPQFRSGKASDIISTLVSIYDTREVIIKELQVLLGQRLLAVKDYDAVKEIRTIELLKLRFGEATLQVCDVMLKDMADSKRIDDRVQGDAKSVVHPLVISRMFWPNIPASSLHLTPKLEKMQQQYETAFHHFKPDKRLRWLQHIGTAVVKLELEDRVVEVETTPLQASISELFEGQAVWDTAAMSERLGVDLAQIRNGLAFWANEGVVKEQGGQWHLLEVAETGVKTTTFVEEEQGIESAGQADAESVRVYWQFIKGMLINLGPKTVEEIQRNLEMFTDDYAQTQEELEVFMQAVRQEGLVDVKSDGKWVLMQGE